MNENELYHFGVKGMKWGVRRNRSSFVSTSGPKRLPGTYASDGNGWTAKAKRLPGAIVKTSNGNSSFRTRRLQRAVNANDRDVRSLKSAGYKKEAAAVKSVGNKNRAKLVKSQARDAAKNNPEAKAARKEKLKKAAIIGTAVAGTALAAYGAYKVSKAIKDKNVQIMERKGREAANKYWNDNWTDHTVSKYKSGSTIVTSRNASSQTYTKFSNADSAEKWINRIKDQNKNVSAKADKIYEDYYYKGKNAKLGEAAKNVYQYYRHRK